MPAPPGVAYGSVVQRPDPRGSFREVWRKSERDEPFVQLNLSVSAPRVLRGMHLHLRQIDHWIVVRGRLFCALVDVRPLLRADGRPAVDTRELRANDTVTVPCGVAHGFLAFEETELLYLVTNEYDGTDELGFAWDDPAVAVPWPSEWVPPLLSDRDRHNASLEELLARLR